MYVNKKKSTCIRFGRRHTEQCAELVTADSEHDLSWVDRCHYLGVHFTRGCSLRCCFEEANLVSLWRLTPFSVQRAAVHSNLWSRVCYVANVCLFLANVNYVTFAICHRSSVCRLSVCRLSLCLSSVTLVRPTQPVEIFGNFFTIRYPRDSSLLMPKIVGGGRPFPPEICVQSIQPPSNSSVSTNIGS